MSDNRDVQAEQENTVDQTVQNAEEAQVEASQAEGVELDENAQRIYELETALLRRKQPSKNSKMACFVRVQTLTTHVVVLKVK